MGSDRPSPQGRRTRDVLPVGLLGYDDDCGFCTSSALRAVRVFGLTALVLPLSAIDLAAVGIDPERATREMPFVRPDGVVVYGHHAWAAALQTGRPWARLLGDVLASRPVGLLAAPAYRWIAGNRHRLPGGTQACELPRG